MRRSLGVLLTATVLWLLTLVPYDVIRQERIRAFGESPAPAQVVGKDLGHRDGLALHLLTYRYLGPEGLPRERTAAIGADMWRAVRIGGTVTVYYATGEPNLSRLRGEREEPFRLWLRRFARGDDLPEAMPQNSE